MLRETEGIVKELEAIETRVVCSVRSHVYYVDTVVHTPYAFQLDDAADDCLLK